MTAWIALTLVIAACGDDGSATTSTTITDAATTTIATTTTTTLASSTTTTAAAPTTAPTTTTTTAAIRAVPSGSGCTPTSDPLPDGDWFGFIQNFNTPPSGYVEILFDLACYFEGDEADLAAIEDGYVGEIEAPPWVRNHNERIYIVPASADTIVDDIFLGELLIHDWMSALDHESGCSAFTSYRACPVWLQIVEGTVVLIYGMLPEWSGDGRGA